MLSRLWIKTSARISAFIVFALLACNPARADGMLDNMLASVEAATGTWLSRAVNVALGIFAALAVLELAWTGVQAVLKKGEVSDLIGSITLKIAGLAFFYTLIVKAPEWLPLIPQSFQQAGQTISGVTSALTPSGLIDQGVNLVGALWEKTANDISIFDVGSFPLAIAAAIAAFILLIGFAILAIQMFIVKLEMLLIFAGGAMMLGFSGSRWSMNFAEKYIGYGVSTGAKFIVISLLAGLATTFVNDVTNNINGANSIEFKTLASLSGSGILFALASYMTPSLAGSFLSGAASMSLSNTAAAGASIAGGTAATVGAAAAPAALAASRAAGVVARLAAPAAAAGSIIGLRHGGGGGGGASVSGAAASAFAGARAAGSGGGGESHLSGLMSAAARGMSSRGGGGAAQQRRSSTEDASPSTSAKASAGFVDPAALTNTSAAGGASSASAREHDNSDDRAFKQEARAAESAQKPAMDYREEEAMRRKEMRARMSQSKLSRMMLKIADKSDDAAKSAFDAARRRRHLASDGHTGSSPSVKMGV
jgi:type IV secretion system protein TrbL